MNYLIRGLLAAHLGAVPSCEFEGGLLVEQADLEAALPHLGFIVATCESTAWDGIEAITLRRVRGERPERVVALNIPPPETAEEKATREAAEKRVQSREAYIKACGARFEKTLSGTRDAISRGHADVERLQADLVKRIRETKGAERKLEQLERSRPEATGGYGQEFDKLLAVRGVVDVTVDGSKLSVFTDVLFCIDSRTGNRHEIGAFRIDIDANRGEVRWHNLTRKVDGYRGRMNAPHVWESGEACLGTFAEIQAELVGNHEYAALAMVAIQFVESVNTGDPAGRHIDKWPVAA